MNKHHEELGIQLELLIDAQNDLKTSFDVFESNWKNKKEFSCLLEINRWEEEVIDRIRQVASKVRTTVNEMMTKNMSDTRRRLSQLAFDMQQRQQEGNYLDNDIADIRNQLAQLNSSVKDLHEKIRIDCKPADTVDWASLIYVTTNKKSIENSFDFSDFSDEQESSQARIWNNLRKFLRNKYTNNAYKIKQMYFKRNTSSLLEPIILTSFGLSVCSFSEEDSHLNSRSIISNSFQKDSLSDEEIFYQRTVQSIKQDYLLPQVSDA